MLINKPKQVKSKQVHSIGQLTHSGLPSEVIQKIKQVFAQHPNIQSVILYGSRAIGNYRHGSDIDLTIVSATLNHAELANIATQLDDLLLPYSIDLSLQSSIQNPALIAHIEQIGQVFYQATENQH